MKGFRYYGGKIAARLENRFSRQRILEGSVITNAQRSLGYYDQVLVFLDNPFSHIGDQIFFKPLATHLSNLPCRVAVRSRPNVSFLFANVGSEFELKPGERLLVISKQEAKRDIQKRFGQACDWFLFQLHQTNINEPISDYLLNAVWSYFNIGERKPITSACYRDFPKITDGTTKFARLNGKKLVLYNDYVDSGKWRAWGLPERLSARLQMDRCHDDTVVLVGSQQDKRDDRRDLSRFADVDLRGQTTVADLFCLFESQNIRRVYCCDTAILHVANIFETSVTLAFRRFFLPGESEQKKRAFSRMFQNSKATIEFL